MVRYCTCSDFFRLLAGNWRLLPKLSHAVTLRAWVLIVFMLAGALDQPGGLSTTAYAQGAPPLISKSERPEPRVILGIGPEDKQQINPQQSVRHSAPTATTSSGRPTIGITLPQPTHKIVEPSPISKIQEPEPLARTVLPEAPGQPRIVAPSGPALSVAPVSNIPLLARQVAVAAPDRVMLAGRGLTVPAALNTDTGPTTLPFLISSDPRPSYGPDTFIATARAAERYLAIADRGGWPDLPADTNLSEGASGTKVLALKQILNSVGDLGDKELLNPRYDTTTTDAVKAFQARHGLAQNGTVSGRTLIELNVPARTRYAQLTGSAQRLSQSGFGFGPRYLVVNIPSAMLEAVENGQVVRRYAAIVGRTDRPSPTLETRATAVNLNPFWTVPASIVQADIAPAMLRDPSYLGRARIRVYDARGTEIDPTTIDWKSGKLNALVLRQEPGATNALGRIRIDMPNKQSVYLHDTPSQRLFTRDDRFHSSGCVRVADIADLAAWLLAETPGPDKRMIDKASILNATRDGERRDINIAKPVPIIWLYLTGYAERNGNVHFRPDIYSLDQPKTRAAR
jgi:L,D-transpeptidase YcbB